MKIRRSNPSSLFLENVPKEFNTLIWGNNFLWDSQFSTLVEAAMREIMAGRKVVMTFCAASLMTCPANPANHRVICVACQVIQRKQKRVVRKAGIHVSILKRTGTFPKVAHAQGENLTQQHLLAKTSRGFPVGAYALSELRHDTRRTRLDTKSVNRGFQVADWADELIKLGQSLVKNHTFSHIFVWNGRRVSDGLIASVLEQNGISAQCVVTGYSLQTIMTRCGSSLLQNVESDFETFRKHNSDFDLAKIEHYAEEALKELHRYSSLRGVPGALNFETDREINEFVDPFVLVATSNWAIEASHLPQARRYEADDMFRKQLMALHREMLDSDMRVIVRWHPGLRRANKATNQWITELRQLTDTWIHIAPESSISTETLARSAQLVIDCGTTIGLYSRIIGTPTISCGPGSRFLPIDRILSSERSLVEEVKTQLQDFSANPSQAIERRLAVEWVFFGKSRSDDPRQWTKLGGVHGPAYVRQNGIWMDISPRMLALRPSRLRQFVKVATPSSANRTTKSLLQPRSKDRRRISGLSHSRLFRFAQDRWKGSIDQRHH